MLLLFEMADRKDERFQAGGIGAALLIGAVAGLYPSVRAARLSPTEAERSRSPGVTG